MNTIKTFEDLQNMGTNVIHEQTHIARHKLESMLNKSFGELTRVQFMGFVSILEREYGIDLSTLRDEYNQYIEVNPDLLMAKESVVLQAQSRSRQKWVIGGIIAIGLLIALASMMQGRLTSAPQEEVMKLSSATVEVVDQNSDQNSSAEINMTAAAAAVEMNATGAKYEHNVTMEADPAAMTLGNGVTIKPLSKVWIGMMDLATGEKTQKITKDPIALDSSKSWLLIFGHGRLEITTSEGKKTLKERNTVWFSYENGMLTQLSHDQFTAKNNGTNW
ncbi:MAG TPA: hypothetical protein VFX57_07975 [Sulfuricurvum sp.]|nr:hypothetical protein [Sulfuricurvum sp.]